MSFIQTFFKRILPASWAADMEAESRKWIIPCKDCGHKQSLWEIGGIRWRSTPGDKGIKIKCPNCGRSGWTKMTKVETPSH